MENSPTTTRQDPTMGPLAHHGRTTTTPGSGCIPDTSWDFSASHPGSVSRVGCRIRQGLEGFRKTKGSERLCMCPDLPWIWVATTEGAVTPTGNGEFTTDRWNQGVRAGIWWGAQYVAPSWNPTSRPTKLGRVPQWLERTSSSRPRLETASSLGDCHFRHTVWNMELMKKVSGLAKGLSRLACLKGKRRLLAFRVY